MSWRIKLLVFLCLPEKKSNLPSPNIRLCPIPHFYFFQFFLKIEWSFLLSVEVC